MTAELDVLAIVRRLRREPACIGQAIAPPLGREAIMAMIPHRPPFLLLDELVRFDRARPSITARRLVAHDDPILAGHFPGAPIYPGALQIEAIAQAGTCLLAQRGLVGPGLQTVKSIPKVVGTRVHHAVFLRSVLPGDTMDIAVQLVADDGLLSVIAGQIWASGRLCAISVLEAYVDAG